MADDRIAEIEETVRALLAPMPEVELLYVAGRDDDHPMRTRKAGTYRVVLSGWAATLHRAAVHRVVSPTPGRSDESLRREMDDQLATLLREQRSRASAGHRAAGLSEPVARLPFDPENDSLDVEHVVTDLLTVSRLQIEEGDDAGVRRRLSLAVNRHLRERENPTRPPPGDVTMDRWVLDMALPLGGGRATLQRGSLFLKDRIPETVRTALGTLSGRPLSVIAEAPGIDHHLIDTVACGRIMASDPRPHARDCATVVSLMGNTPGRVRDLLGPR